MGVDNREVERKADVLMDDLQRGDLGKMQERLQWEARNKPEEFDAVVRRFRDKDAEMCKQKNILPHVELHEDGGFLGTGLGSHVDDVKIKGHDRYGRPAMRDVYDKEPQEKQNPYEQQGIYGLNHANQQSQSGWEQQGIYGVNQQQREVNTNSLWRAAENMYNVPKGFTSYARQESNNYYNQESNYYNGHTYNNRALPIARFGQY